MWNDIVSALPVLGGIAFLTAVVYLYYNSPKVRSFVSLLLPYLPVLLSILASRTRDTDKVFDKHDALVLASDVAQRIKGVLADPENTRFEDVEDDIFRLVEVELEKYRKAGVQGVPELNSDAIRQQVRIAFDIAKQLRQLEISQNEDTAGNGNQDQGAR